MKNFDKLPNFIAIHQRVNGRFSISSTLVLLTIFTCFLGMIPSLASGSRLGEMCTYDDDCDVSYSYCRGQRTCECKKGFEPSPSRDKCIATIGAICNTHYDCMGLPNSECSRDVCTCRNGYVPHPTQKECLQVARLYEASCVEHAQCTSGFDDRIECKNGRCQCIPMHHYADGMCIASKGLDQLCTSSKECHVSDVDDDKNEQVTCTAGRCQCIIGYHVATDGKTCTDGVGAVPVTSIISLLIATLLLYKFI